ncbi:hypothetical protein PsorP6_015755 [Peronosclerospora sorghi]|uniref:Uncharacterized protein n=1 Tax=Peronosclerospora sorghi TaxID=230839 RepID=A0ACC0WMW7_9STRA|nr:hypothetical protein PsorP6_015755 [Peronosclerospora sorghi]
MHFEWPPVTRLVVYLPGQHNVLFREDEDLAQVPKRAAGQLTTLTAYFAYNAEHEDSLHVLYVGFPKYYVWKIQAKAWAPRQRGASSVG